MRRRRSLRLLNAVAGISIGLLLAINTATLAVPAEAKSAVTPLAGCAPVAAAHAGVSNLTAKDGTGRTRTYLLQAPAAYSASHRYPLIFVFHGAGGNAKQSVSWGLQDVTGAAATGIFVFPDGIPYKKDGIGWDDSALGYDLPFFDSMLKDVAADYCVDRERVFIAGFSWGGDFAITLACTRGDVIRAIAANSTDDEFKDPADYMTYQNFPCSSRVHPSVRFQHAVGGDKSYPAPLFATTSKLLQHLNACSAISSSLPATTGAMSCVSFSACTSEYVECPFDARIGHALPPNWAADTWAFFSRF